MCRSDFIGKAIDSVLNQTYTNFEIIIIDDGSTDNTREVAEAYGDKVRYFKQQNNSGVAAARNAGITRAEGEYIAFLDSDDFFLMNNLEKKVSFFKNHPKEAWVYSDWQYVDTEGNLLKRGSEKFSYQDKKLNGYIFKELIDHRNFISPCTVILKKTILEDIGYFDSSIPSQEEYDLWLRISLKYPVHYLDEPLVHATVHPDSLSGDFGKWAKGNEKIVDKLVKIIPEDFPDKKKLLKRMHADKYTFLGRDSFGRKEYWEALAYYLESVKRLPFQKKVFWLIAKTEFLYIKQRLLKQTKKETTGMVIKK